MVSGKESQLSQKLTRHLLPPSCVPLLPSAWQLVALALLLQVAPCGSSFSLKPQTHLDMVSGNHLPWLQQIAGKYNRNRVITYADHVLLGEPI